MTTIRRLAGVCLVTLFATVAYADYNYEYYEGDWNALPDFDSLAPVGTGTTPTFDISLGLRDFQFGFRFTGNITVATDDTYTFYTYSDDGSQLFIDGTLVVDNDLVHGPTEESGLISLTAGSYAITVTFFEQGGGEVLDVSWSNTENGQQAIPPSGIIGELPDLSAIGQWGPVIAWPHVAVSAANLPDGRVLTWSGSERDTWPTTEQTYSGTWDPATGDFIEVLHDTHNMFCAHLAMAEDGRVFVNGGRNQTNSPWTSLFDYRDDSWVQIENMASGGRWYPTTLALTDGDMFTAIGTATNQRNPERWDPDNGWLVQSGIDFNDMVLDDYTHGERQFWPLLHLAPNGKILHSGPTPQMHWINPTGSGEYEPVGGLLTDFYHKHGTTIMYDEGKLLTAGGWIGGGSITSTNQAFTVDLNGPTPVVTPTQAMIHARKFQNGVMLPNGEVLVVGGNTSGQKFSDNGAILAPEIWDPNTESWRLGAPMTIPRNYHSIALLLTDGRVLAAGSGYNSNSVPASTHQDGQVYSPPYLFNPVDGSPALRPAISSGPGAVETGTTFNVTTSEAVAYFSMIKMSSTTHGMNTDVRYLRPQVASAGASSYDITLHQNPNVASPGYWMLFAVNAAGVPSEAHVIRVTTVDTRFENRALSGTTSQSSTPVSGDLQAANAIDGDLTGTAASGSLASTDIDNNAWWEVDLGQVQDIDTVRLWNRTDCCASALADFYVLISEDPFTSQDLATTLAQPGVIQFYNAGVAGRQTDLGVGGVRGQYLRVQLTAPNNLQLAEVQVFGAPAPVVPPSGIKAENGTRENVGSDWQIVPLAQTYTDPVVIASAQYDETQPPAVARVRNVTASQFEVKVQNPNNTPITGGYGVQYLVVEAGVYTEAEDGIAMEAAKFTSSLTQGTGAWATEAGSYQQSYANPVVLGQVMTANDPRWSVFWAHDGTRVGAPTATDLRLGKHVGEDPDKVRAFETIGYLVIEAGSGSIAAFNYEAGITADIVRSVIQSPPYVTAVNVQYELGVVSSAGMDGDDGAWPLLYGSDPLAGAQIALAVDEDDVNDAERKHTTEEVAYIAMTRSAAGLAVAGVSTSPEASGSEVTFVANATGPGPLQYSWLIDGVVIPFSTDNMAMYTFTAAGRHTITLTVRDALGNEQQHTFTQLVHLPLTVGSPSVSGGVLEYASRNEVWNVNPDNDSVTVIIPALQSVVAEIFVPDEPRSLAIAPDGQVWVTSKGAATVSVIDPATYNVTQMHFLDVGSQPHGLAMGPSSAYVALEATGEVISIDTITGGILQRETVGGRPRHVALDAAAANLFVSLFVTPPLTGEASADPDVLSDGGKVLVLDPGTLVNITTIDLQHSDRGVSEHSGPGVPNYLGPAVISPDGTSAWVPSKQDNILAGALRGGPGLTFDQTVRAVVSKIQLPAATEDFTMRGDLDNASVASHAAFDPFGLHLFTALEGNREISVTDVHSGNELLRFDVGRAPQSVAVSADGTRLYVHNFMDRSLGIYDVSSLVHSGVVEATEISTVSTVASESLAPDVLLGKQLFYDARDDRLAALDYMSCASCHNAGQGDGRVWDFTGLGEGLRNTVSMQGRAGMGHGFVHWSANFDEIHDFEDNIRNFQGGTGLMSDTDFNTGTRSQPLGDPKAGISTDLDALAAYVASLSDVPASPYRDLDGTLSDAAEDGAVLFESEGCSGCHTLTTLTDSSDGSGLHDVGTITPDSGNRLGGPLNGIDTPTLLGAWSTAPYLHDGSQATLQLAIDAHQGVSLTAAQLDQLAALISELDDGAELLPPAVHKLATGVVSSVGSSWQTVTLADSYDDMVVIASVQYDDSAPPTVPRIRNAGGNTFEVSVQNPADAILTNYTVHYVAVEAGVYTLADHGITMEATKFESSLTQGAGNWGSETGTYQQSYVNPVVVGQVMTANDPRWSVFWAHDGTRVGPPTATELRVGKHVGEDPDNVRATETLGYLVIEAGVGSVGGINYEAGISADIVRGVVNNPPYVTSVSGQYATGVVSAAGIDGNNGAWPLLYGNDPLAGAELDLAVEEDDANDAERKHTTEEVAYFLLQ